MPMNAIEKILARSSQSESVAPGDIVVCEPDLVVQHEGILQAPGSWFRPTRLFDPDRVALVFDHAVPSVNVGFAKGMSEGRSFADQFGIEKFFDVGRHGISHVILADTGNILPGQLITNSDSHAAAAGAFNCLGRGVGGLDTLQAMTLGRAWFMVTPTVRYEIHGRLQPWTYGKDVLFHIGQEWGDHNGLSVEFGGPGLADLPLTDRRTLSTMCVELGVDFALFEYDDAVGDFLAGRAQKPYEPVFPDAGATYEEVRILDLDPIEPFVVLPHFLPKNALPVSELGEEISIDQAFVGSCANGMLSDLRTVADVVRGHRVAPGVRLVVTPASQEIYLDAVREGIVEAIVEAGGVVTNSTCGACCGVSTGVVGPGEVCLTASTRNFRGRMGSPEALVYMGSPATVAASALRGVITDPRTMSDLTGAGAR